MTERSTKNKIIQVMYDLIAEKGYDKTSIGQIAEQIGIKKASVYYYFKSKEDIFLQIAQTLYQTDYTDQEQHFQQADSPQAYQKQLLAFGEALIDSYFENPVLRKVYAEIDLQTTRIPALKEIMKAADKNLNQFFTSCLFKGIHLGVFPQDFDVVIHTQILYTLFIGIDAAILYALPIEPKAVWRETVSKLFDRKEILSV